MSRTAIGLFENPAIAKQVAVELKNLPAPLTEVRILGEPLDLPVSDEMDTPRMDFEVALERDMLKFGASRIEAENYVRGLRRGGALVLATGSGDEVERAVDVMNQRGAVEVEEFAGRKTASMGSSVGEPAMIGNEDFEQAGRLRERRGGARVFVW